MGKDVELGEKTPKREGRVVIACGPSTGERCRVRGWRWPRGQHRTHRVCSIREKGGEGSERG